MEPILTTHARIRCRQRNVSIGVVRAVLKYRDIEMASYGGCWLFQLSHKAVDKMLADGVGLAEADAAKKVVLIVNANDCVVTVLKIRSCDRRIRTRPSKSARNRLRR